MPAKRDILFPVFLECCRYTDAYWSQIFEDLSYGKCPYGCYISKNFICCNFRGKEFSYQIDINKEPETIYNEVYNLLHNKMGLSSKQQQIDQLKNIEDTESEWKNRKWNNLKKKNIRDMLIDNYIITQKNKYNLDHTNTFRLKNILLTGILFKTINSNDIDYYDGIIQRIEGIHFAENKLIIDPSITQYTPVVEKNTRIKKKKLADLWINNDNDNDNDNDFESEFDD